MADALLLSHTEWGDPHPHVHDGLYASLPVLPALLLPLPPWLPLPLHRRRWAGNPARSSFAWH